jgi:hypothetical protein
VRAARHLPGAKKFLQGLYVSVHHGGWGTNNLPAFLTPEGRWNELNARTAVAAWMGKRAVENAIGAWARSHGVKTGTRLREALTLLERSTAECIPLPVFAKKTLFFRRVRIPPYLPVHWEHITINPFIRDFIRAYTREGKREARTSARTRVYDAVLASKKAFGNRFHEDIARWEALCVLLTHVHDYILLPYTKASAERLRLAIKEYYRADPQGWNVSFDDRKQALHARLLFRVMRKTLRTGARYGVKDAYLLRPGLFFFAWMVMPVAKKSLPSFVNHIAMPIETVLR